MVIQQAWRLRWIMATLYVALLFLRTNSLEISDVLGGGLPSSPSTAGFSDPVARTHGRLEGNLGGGVASRVPFGSGSTDWDVDNVAMEAPDFSLNGKWDPPVKRSSRTMSMKGARTEKSGGVTTGSKKETKSAAFGGKGGGREVQKTPPTLDWQLDEQFAQYALQVVFVSVVEDFDVAKQTSRDFFMNEVGRVYRDMCREEALRDNTLKKKDKDSTVTDFLRGKHLTEPAYFSAYLHAQLKVASWYLSDAKSRDRTMQRVGRRLFDMLRAYLDLDKDISKTDGAPSFSDLKRWLRNVVRKIIAWGCFADAGVSWQSGAEKEWSDSGSASFTFWYKGPVTLQPSAADVREMSGLEQELASRMIEAFFMSLAIDVTNENPKSFLQLLKTGLETGWDEAVNEKVKERWTIQSL